MPTRVDHGRRRADPGRDDARAQGCTSRQHLDDLRLLLMREPRGHARDVGGDPPAAAARRTPTGACCSSRSAAACRCAGTGRSASRRCSSRPGWSRCSEPETIDPARHAGRAGRGARRGARTARATAVTLRNVPAFVSALRPRRRRAAAPSCATTWPSAATSTRSSTPRTVGVAVDPARAGELIARGARGHGGDRRRRPPGASGRPAHRGLPPRRSSTSPAATAPTRSRRRRSTRAGWTARRAAPARARRWRVCHARGELALGEPFVNAVGDRHALHRAARRGDRGRRRARGRSRRSPGARGSPAMGQYLLDASDPFPAGFAL